MQSWSGLSTRRTGLGVLEGERLWRGGEAWHPGQGKGFWRESIFGGEVKYGNFGGEVRLASGRFWQVLAGSGRFWQVWRGGEAGIWQVLAGSGRFWQVLAGSGIWASGTGRVLASGHLGIWCLASGRVLASGHLGCEL